MASVAHLPASAPAAGIQKFAPQSSWVAEFEYDAASLRLTTHLKSGAIYQHTFVTPLEFEALKTAQNHSKHWSRQIKGKKASITVKSAKAPNSKAKKIVRR